MNDIVDQDWLIFCAAQARFKLQRITNPGRTVYLNLNRNICIGIVSKHLHRLGMPRFHKAS